MKTNLYNAVRGFGQGAIQQVIRPDCSTASLSSIFLTFKLNALCSQPVNSGVRRFLITRKALINEDAK